ncbi:MAG TPA: type II toxin-antitoxin system VapC family toxin [Anaerolineae bacterium]|nr:type II toxin-antitoxin system VapC family toxin [Anaerolineae bacterium]
MTRSLVIDASFAFKLILPNPRQAHFRALMAQWKQDGYGMCAPTLWVYEITSALCKVVHFGHLQSDEGAEALALAQGLGMHLIPPDDAQARLAFDWTMRLDRAAAYDSFYLALAETLGCELWTTDRHLYNAVAQPWVRCVSNE